jgi:hypothetical protein
MIKNIIYIFFSYLISFFFQLGAIITFKPLTIIEKNNILLNENKFQERNRFYCSKKIVLTDINDEELERYYKIVELYQSKHYWTGLYSQNSKLLENSLILYHYNFIPNIYETSIMKVLLNSENKDDYQLILITTDISLIHGYYKWFFKYDNNTNIITLEYIKEGIANTNFIGKVILNKDYMTKQNEIFIANELDVLTKYIKCNRKDDILITKI